MAPIGKLYGLVSNPRVRRVLAVAKLAGVELETDSSFTMTQDWKTPEFLAKFPFGYLPAFEGKDGLKLQECAAIADYIAAISPNANLVPTEPEALAEVRSWEAFADQELMVKLALANRILRNVLPYNKAIFDGIIGDVLARLEVLDKILLKKTFLVGERITLADVFVASAVAHSFTALIDASMRKKIPNVVRFVDTVVKSPKLADVFAGLEYAEKQAAFVPPAKKEKAPKAPKAEKPKEEKKEKAPKKKEVEEEEEEPLVPAEPKAKNPLDSLPKSSFNLEEWKRQYSNLDTRGAGGSLEWFDKNFDREGFSVWRCDFKYPEDLTLTFMSANQIGGLHTRWEASRKYLMSSIGVLGKNNDSVISGAIIVRGQDAFPVVEVAPDAESYQFTRLDLDKPEDKEFFEAAMAWDLKVDGREWADGKNFK